MKSYVNIAGLVAVTIALAHIGQICKVSVINNGSIYAFQFLTPWFFFKSGLCFKPGCNIMVRFRNLLLPFIVFTIIGCVVNSFYLYADNDSNWKHHLLIPVIELICDGATASNPPVWFLLSLFFCHVIYDKLIPLLRDSVVKNFLLVISCVLIAWFCNAYNFHKPVYLANTLAGLALMASGYSVKDRQYEPRIFILCTLIIIIFVCTSIPCIDIRSNTLLNGYYPFYYLYSLACCIVVNNLFYRLPICNKFFLTLGLNSYFIYVLHWVVITVVYRSINYLFPNISFTLLVWGVIIGTTISLAILCVINNKYGGMKLITKIAYKRESRIDATASR